MGQTVNGIISGLDFSDVIDILIISYIVYKLMGFLKNSRAEQLTKGLAVIVIAYFISDFCHFYTTHWILKQILGAGIISLVVIFQPEIRRTLELLGRGKLGRANSVKEEAMAANVETIVRSLDYFSKRKEGAIIVVERDTALSDIAETGTQVDADLSEPLLENIFYKGSPLHDGAVIIRGTRILAAGCVLPLTTNPNLSTDLGTRHRAGIGISEVSDALVLIVSEETGIISMANDGKLSRFLDLKTVEKSLLTYYMSTVEIRNNILKDISRIWRKKEEHEEE